ncbi:hypothetical protein COT52_02260 [candidate division WWE3 bacterium CG08_land_8_20_14_0_20_43_13]|uniref:4Fe4S-binding SPASM domain-containing protein n=1 Tax=candidate division WWE3 bacterium CG08_land_8_20_14_0_20_43_13 TaxID=1975087 RepID=A0A2H0X723_UNCKA|nr:MAG: hypothetical protein COT52_02260 [candidate division WWE3 bacterium CG08_land_8_20_14_0_20_43_13]
MTSGKRIVPTTIYRRGCPPYSLTFSPDGQIYGGKCVVGIAKFSLGRYYPKLKWNRKNIILLKNRQSIYLKECQDCPLVFICGGNCFLGAYTRNGDTNKPYCRNAMSNLEEFIAMER